MTPAVVQEGVALGRRAVGRPPCGPPPWPRPESRRRRRAPLDPGVEAGVGLDPVQAGAASRRAHLGDRAVGLRGRRAGVAAQTPQRSRRGSAARSTSNDPQAVGGQHPLHGQQRQVGEVLVVDGVELHLLDQAAAGAGTRSVSDALRLEHVAEARPTKSSRSGTWARTLLATIRSAARPAPTRSLGRLPRRRTAPRWACPCALATSAMLAAGSIPEHRDAGGHEVLQQVAVVAGDLDHQAVGPEAEPVDRRLGVAPRQCSSQLVGVGGEVGVVARRSSSGETSASTCTRRQASQTGRAAGRAARRRLQLLRRQVAVGQRLAARGRRTCRSAARGRTGRSAGVATAVTGQLLVGRDLDRWPGRRRSLAAPAACPVPLDRPRAARCRGRAAGASRGSALARLASSEAWASPAAGSLTGSQRRRPELGGPLDQVATGTRRRGRARS